MTTTLHRHLLEPHPANRKHFKPELMAELHADIAARGVLDDLLVRALPGRDGSDGRATHQILSGERRWRASEGTPSAGALPCKVLDVDDLAALELVAVPNIQREDLHPLDEATVFEQMLLEPPAWVRPESQPRLAGYTVEQLADRVHKKPAYVRARLRLLGLTPGARNAFFDDAFGIGSALQIARLNTQHQEEIVVALLHDRNKGAPWPAEVISHQVQSRYMLRLAGAPFDLRDVALVPEAGACDACPKRSGTNPELFDDIAEGDTCTDRACFATKCEAHQLRRVESARAKGWTVISGTEAERLLPTADATVKGYLRLDRPSEYALSAKPLAEVLGDDGVRDAALIVRGMGADAPAALVEVMPTAIVRQALKAKGLLREDDAPAPKPAREKKAKAAEPPAAAPGAAPVPVPAPAPAPQATEDPFVAAMLQDLRVFLPSDLHGKNGKPSAPTAGRQLVRVASATQEVQRVLTLQRIGAALRNPGEAGFPAAGLSQLIARSMEPLFGSDEIRRLAALVGVEIPTAPRRTAYTNILDFDFWRLDDLQAERMAIVLLAAQEEFRTQEPPPWDVVAQSLGVAVADLPTRAADIVNEQVKLELVAAAPPARPPAAKKQPGAKRSAKVPAKYRDPTTGDTWSGRGLQPNWLRQKLAAGAQLAGFLIVPEAA